MNIFRILSSNDGSINEPNVSSFLAYLLNPNEDHGISGLLLQEILNELLLVNDGFLQKIKFDNRITDLSKYSGYSINIVPEMTVNLNDDGKKKRRDIDILIEIIDDRSKEVLYAICLENKITDASISKKDSQLEDELSGLRNYYKENELSPEIYVVYLTPHPSEISTYSFDKLDYTKKCHIYWDKHENSFFNKLIKIFKDEENCLVDPINNQSSYLIKSFLSFIKTNFKSYVEERKEIQEKKSYGKPVIDLLNDFANNLEFDKEYSSSSIRNKFSTYVLTISGLELNNGTRNAHITLATVNDRNRGHYGVKKPDDERKNIFYYTDDSRKKLKRYCPQNSELVDIYFKNGDEIELVSSLEIQKE